MCPTMLQGRATSLSLQFLFFFFFPIKFFYCFFSLVSKWYIFGIRILENKEKLKENYKVGVQG